MEFKTNHQWFDWIQIRAILWALIIITWIAGKLTWIISPTTSWIFVRCSKLTWLIIWCCNYIFCNLKCTEEESALSFFVELMNGSMSGCLCRLNFVTYFDLSKRHGEKCINTLLLAWEAPKWCLAALDFSWNPAAWVNQLQNFVMLCEGTSP